ncbi:hypothetical protein OG357_27915 [Streptomyces sp. NBC_01255]|uniref:hypothetical protein n=1 Tax=Streptomyces sp. NBC_01255 TaxID=2903798 RepID=UPI002E34C4C8|nr:hypothetical protein [Streptomyces sp. NBC_01255]
MKGPEFDLPPLAPPDVVAEWDELADAVCRELVRAGLPAHRGDVEGGPPGLPGAEVHVDRVADGGVYVDWRAGAELATTALELFAKGIDYTDPPSVVRHHRDVCTFMRDALTGILASAGFRVEESDPHTHGCAVYVKGLQSA